MPFIAKKITAMIVQTSLGDLVLEAKSGEDPEIKPITNSIEDADDGMTNAGSLILNSVPTRSYIQQVWGYKDEDLDKLKAVLNAAKAGNEVPVNAVMSDDSIYSNSGTFVGEITYNGTATIELKFVSGSDWITT